MLHQIRNLLLLGVLAASVAASGHHKVNCNDCAKRIEDCVKTCQDKGDDPQLKPFACETRCLCHTVLLDPLCREKCKYDDPRTCPH